MRNVTANSFAAYDEKHSKENEINGNSLSCNVSAVNVLGTNDG